MKRNEWKLLNWALKVSDPNTVRCCSLLGSRGREKGEFTNLQGISASSNGRVVVADSNNQCIQVRTHIWNQWNQAVWIEIQLHSTLSFLSLILSVCLSLSHPGFFQRRPVQDAVWGQRSISGTAAETYGRHRGHERRHRGGRLRQPMGQHLLL